MKFVYIGSPVPYEGEPTEVDTMGYHFVRNGEPVEVSGRAEEKLAHNSHFKHVPDHQELEVAEEKPKKLSAPKRGHWGRSSS